jgi:hypothetical protein
VIANHLDEHDQICTRHPAAPSDDLLSLAIVGSRAPSFHHDLASKLQGLMMAIDEIGELVAADSPPITRAIETAHTTLREVLGLLNVNRALTKAPTKSRTTFAEIAARASERVYVSLKVTIPAATLEVSSPSLIHALALVFDVAGGPGRGRALAATAELAGGRVVMTLTASPEPPPNAAESLALAAFVFAREGGELRCADEGRALIVRLPVVV